ncbi:MAG: MFS transporter, partial [Pseudomonadota bacterium]|nr:MFS transporter [Pseudomonadota bacterium]
MVTSGRALTEIDKTVRVTEVIDAAPLSRYQWRVALLCVLVGVIDGFENGVVAYVAPALAADLSIAVPALGQVFAAGTLGMACGTMILGSVGDLWGRKRAVLLSVLVFGVAALATAAAQTIGELMLWRFVAGIAIGGAQPVMVALLSEYAPARHRSAAMVFGFVGTGTGVPTSALLSAVLVPEYGWQVVFVIGGVVPLLLLPWLMVVFPESIRYQVNRGPGSAPQVAHTLNRIVGGSRYSPADRFELQEPPAARGSVMALLSPPYRGATLAIWSVYCSNWVAWYLFLLWLPTALTEAGLPDARAALVGAGMGVTALLVMIPAAVVVQRAGARRAMLWLFGLGVLLAAALVAAGTRWWLVIILVMPFTICIVIPQVALNYLCVQLYPTSIRATGVSWAVSAGRIGSILGAFGGGSVIAGFGLAGFFAAVGLPLILAGLLVVLAFRRERTGP